IPLGQIQNSKLALVLLVIGVWYLFAVSVGSFCGADLLFIVSKSVFPRKGIFIDIYLGLCIAVHVTYTS
ncbi:unnamed protein product, partial [marine sediment metagenome]